MSYLINAKTNELVAFTAMKLKSGQLVDASFCRSENAINADRDWDLVNAIECKVSNAKKFEVESKLAPCCIEINCNEFYIS